MTVRVMARVWDNGPCNLSQNATSCAPRPMPLLRTSESDTVQAAGQHKMW